MAYICGAKLILECLDRGWSSQLDAQNLWSVALAQKLGYRFDHEYVVYEWDAQVSSARKVSRYSKGTLKEDRK